MIREPVARRYAQAVFEAAAARELLDQVAADLSALAELQARHPEFGRLLAIPKIDQRTKRGLIDELFAGRVHPLVLELLRLLLEKKRLALLEQIIEGFLFLVEEHRGIVRAEVTTARALPPGLEADLVRKLEGRVGKTVRLEKKMDAAILGGMLVRIGDRMIDRSVRRTLHEIRERLMQVPVH